MTQLISVKKDIIFKTRISEITSLNLEHDYKIKDELVDGKLILSGTYKMTEASLVEEEFIYNIPFSIAISDKINKDTINIEIEDFKYETHKDVMKINVDLDFECEEATVINDIDEYVESFNERHEEEYDKIEEDEIKETKIDEENIMKENFYNNVINTELIEEDKKIEEEQILQMPEIENEVTIKDSEKITNSQTVNNLANSIGTNEENYHTYKVYIVRHGDTIEGICSKYNLTAEDLKEYNDLSNINVGDKIVIPQIIND